MKQKIQAFRTGKILILALTVFLFSIAYANADELGCCANPGAGVLTCSDNLVFRDNGCCPQPEASFPEYYKTQSNPDRPANYADCKGIFFYSDKACLSVSACGVGCCCSPTGGSVMPSASCKGDGMTFFNDKTDCKIVCAVSQCNDGIDNDNNGCADFGRDTGCESATDNSESGGTCLNTGANCDNPSYTPKLTGLDISVAKGQKKFLLQWQDECKMKSSYYEISRCEGDGCTNFAVIAKIGTTSFEDASSQLLFGTSYTYSVKAFYILQSATPSITRTAGIGDEKCMGITNQNLFCLNNSGVYCNAANKLVEIGPKCKNTGICSVSGNKASCISKPKCSYRESNPFGLFYTQQGCENNVYCFYDKSYSTINSCFSCDPSMSCYDYKSEQACTGDKCSVGSCEWKGNSDIGSGVCVSKQEYNCKWCDKKGSGAVETIKSYNPIFDACTKEKSTLLSEPNFPCYFSNTESKSCSNIVCTDYSSEQCSNAQITHDKFNNIVNPSSDQCGIKVCQNIDGVCVKNADGDSIPDCSGPDCETDYFAPNTNMLATNRAGAVDQLLIDIYDKTSTKDDYVLRSELNYSTFICLEPCASAGHPYSVNTSSRRLLVRSLKIFDESGRKLINLAEGSNTIDFYSQDPSKNIGKVRQLQIEAHANDSGPTVIYFNVSDGNIVNGKAYTKNQQPSVYLKFIEPAAITFASVLNNKTGLSIPLSSNGQLSNNLVLTIQQNLPAGEYTLSVNAKNSKNILMPAPFTSTIVIDNVAPSLALFPLNGSVMNVSAFAVNLSFSEEVVIDNASVNSISIKDFLSTLNNKLFVATFNFSEGNKLLEASATDYAGNKVKGSTSFTVDAFPTIITLAKPRFGVSSTFIFDIVISTDNNAACRNSLDTNLEYEFMDNFSSTGFTNHTISGFNKIQNGDLKVHRLYVRCRDGKNISSLASFNINVNPTPPSLKRWVALPNPVVESPPITTLNVEANDEVLCKYSAASQQFDSMEGKFLGFDDNLFRNISLQNVTLPEEGNFVYYVACQAKSGLNSDTGSLLIKVDFSIPINITSRTKEFFNSTTVFLSVETNKKSQCKYSETDTTVQNGTVFGAPGYFHNTVLNLPGGKHTFYVTCKDQFRQQWSDVAVISFTVDTTPPTMKYVNDTSTLEANPEKTCFSDRLRVKFLGEDLESLVKEYNYSLTKRNDNTQITSSITPSDGQWMWVNNINLQNNTEYFFSVRARNFGSMESNSLESDGVTYDSSVCTPTTQDCKSRGDCKIDDVCFDHFNCASMFCFNKKCQQPTCTDGKYSGTESDVDCGGPCQTKCSEGKSCSADQDCQSSLKCTSTVCKQPGQNVPVLGEPVPDLNETQAVTQPAGTQQTGLFKSTFFRVILLIFGILILIGGFGYLAYVARERKREEEYSAPRQKEFTSILSQQPVRTFSQRQNVERVEQRPPTLWTPRTIQESLKNRELQRDMERKNIFSTFGEGKKEITAAPIITTPELKTGKTEKLPKAHSKHKQTRPAAKKAHAGKENSRKAYPKKITHLKIPKEDVFIRLKEIAKDSKIKRAQKNKNAQK